MRRVMNVYGELLHYLEQLEGPLSDKERTEYFARARAAAQELADIGRVVNRDSARDVLALMEHEILDVPVMPSSDVGTHTREAWAGLIGILSSRADASQERFDRLMPAAAFERAKARKGAA